MTEHDAIVVLGCATGGGFVSSGRAAKRGELRGAAARRVARAAAAYHAGAAPLVLACGGRRWGGVAEATAMAEALARADVPLPAIKVELVSLSTSENARFAGARLLPGSSRVVLVTCDWHMRRAERAFRNVGFAVTPAPATSPARGIVARTYLAFREAASTAAEIVRGALRSRPPPLRLRVSPARKRHRPLDGGLRRERGAVVARPDRDRGGGDARSRGRRRGRRGEPRRRDPPCCGARARADRLRRRAPRAPPPGLGRGRRRRRARALRPRMDLQGARGRDRRRPRRAVGVARRVEARRPRSELGARSRARQVRDERRGGAPRVVAPRTA